MGLFELVIVFAGVFSIAGISAVIGAFILRKLSWQRDFLQRKGLRLVELLLLKVGLVVISLW